MNVEDDPETGVEGSADAETFRARRRVVGGDGNDTEVREAEGEVRLDVRRLF